CIRRTHHARRRGPRHGHGGAAPADQGLNEGGPMTYRTTVLALLAVAACDGAQSLSAPPLAPDRFGRPDIIVPAGGAMQAAADGVIERCRASGHDDTGIYVGQDTGVTVRQSVTFANVNGIEFENSHYVRALGNEAYDNVVGILVVLLPGLDVKTSSDVLVSGN